MTYHIHLTGQVQGIGFRPFVWQLARTMQLRGTVSNGADGVHITVNTDLTTVREFLTRLQAEAPALARILSATMQEADARTFTDFSIVESQADGPATLLLTPDLAMCDTCRAEINEPANRRFGYAFTTCTHCGPRYSILRKLPYDRPTTTMQSFGMCADCEDEYHDPANRRFYAQTNSCPNCPVALRLFRASGTEVADTQPALVNLVVTALRSGQTVAVKGIGGFLLLCDATNANAVTELRHRKHRPTKPLAVLYPNADTLREDCELADDELALLTGPESPIVLLRQRIKPNSGLVVSHLAPSLSQLGVMLPYAPLLALIAEDFGKPLVATSGNASGSPICYTDEQGLRELPAVADLILTHNRDILVPQDDSVVRLSSAYRQPIVLRRSRGLAPTFAPITSFSPQKGERGSWGEVNILALGASLKSTFAWQLRGNTYISQYLGDLESYDTHLSFRHTLQHFQTLFEATPDVILADRHEEYFSTQLAHELALIWGVPLVTVQHHEAHATAVLAENSLINNPGPVLTVVWDGTGYGTDGHIWGGEFLVYRNGRFDRVSHLAYFDAILGDKMPREPRLSALSLAHRLPEAEPMLRSKFTADEWTLYRNIFPKNRLKTSSVGRLFDGVSALLGLANRVQYEGEAALLLEDRAMCQVEKNGFDSAKSYLPDAFPTGQIPTQTLISGVVRDTVAGVSVNQIAANFHYTLVRAVATIACQTGIRQLAFSGGVFQNALLVDWLRHELDPEFQLFFHHQLSPNDESISFGQLAHYTLSTNQKHHNKTTEDYVLSHSG